jgi:hypothetical protein
VMEEQQKQTLEGTESQTQLHTKAVGATAPGNAADFDDASRPGDLWPEAADARCSEFAALFAGTQPAPLSVV